MIVLYIVAGIAVLLIAFLIGGASYEFAGSRRDRKFLEKTPGELVDAGGYQLHILSSGKRQPGQPVVILEASVGANSLDWQMVQPLVAEFAQVVSYDRAGNGWSESAELERTAENLADDLHRMLHNALIKPPYILVGHRYGGMFVRKFYEKFPADVAGLVLVDASHPDIFDEDNTSEITRLKRNVNLMQRIGLVRMVTGRNYRVSYLNNTSKDEYIAMMMHDNANLLREAIPILRDGIELQETIDVPLTIVSRGEDTDLNREREWADYQRDLATLSDNSKHIFAQSTKNWIVFAEPQTIADAIKNMVVSLSDNED